MRAHPCLPVLFLCLAACPHTLRFGPAGELTDPAELMRLMDQRAVKLRSIKAEARASVKAADQSGTLTEFVAAQRPASLHLESLNFFGKPVAALATDGAQFGLLVDEGATFYSGPASAANVGRLLPVPVEPADAVVLLLGSVRRLEGAQAQLALDRPAGAYLLTLTRGEVRQRLWVGTEDLRLFKSEIRGEAGLDVAFDDFQAFGGQILPMTVELVAVGADGKPAGARVELKFKDLELNVALDPALFTLAPPPGARRLILDAAGNEVAGP